MEYIKDIFQFIEGKPLLFTQLFFWGFFAFVLFFYSFLYKFSKARTAYLFLVSLFFYFKTSGVFIILLLFTIASDFAWGKLISKSTSGLVRKLALVMSVIINLTLLGYFKYSYFIVSSTNEMAGTQMQYFNHFSQFSNTFFGTTFSVDKLILPVGISFFTFQSLSYIIDLYRRKVQPANNIIEYGFFVCFFPHLVAGPIVKAHEFLHQIHQKYHLSRTEFGLAVFWIINGLLKKVMADYIAVNYIDRIFDNPGYYSGLEVVFGIFGYSLQIYADFSGYTDIAIGVALLLGFRLKTNFNSPYKAQSTSEFWQRWHISLSSWLKEYLYIPLGGNRTGSIGSYLSICILIFVFILLAGKAELFYIFFIVALIFSVLMWRFKTFRKTINTNINLMVTMLLGGLWHGSSWMFMIWGGLNGLGLVIHKLWLKFGPDLGSSKFLRFFNILLTLTFISFTRIWFRSDSLDTVSLVFDRIANHTDFSLLFSIVSGYRIVFSVILIGYLIHWIPENKKQNYRLWFANLPVPLMILFIIFTVFVFYQALSSEMQPFIYFQF